MVIASRETKILKGQVVHSLVASDNILDAHGA